MHFENSQEIEKLFMSHLSEEKNLFGSSQNGLPLRIENLAIVNRQIPKYIGEFWTSKQRQASRIHEISYRACFKPQLPRFFVEILSKIGDVIYDPFSGRGTTVIEAALLHRNIAANDINPLSRILTEARLVIPDPDKIKNRLAEIPFLENTRADIDLSMFYHPKTESEIVSLKNYLSLKSDNGREDEIDKWIRMVATNRLTGHSSGFFSVYTLPPNQAVTPEKQRKINELKNQVPEYRDSRKIIMRKTLSLVSNLSATQIAGLLAARSKAKIFTMPATNVYGLNDESVQLTVTSPPFLDVVHYSKDNWLRCWFNSVDIEAISKNITMVKGISEWSRIMGLVFGDLFRITKKNGWVAFEVGEVRRGSIKLEEHIVPLGLSAGFECGGVIINEQRFTKTSNIWGISNNLNGTNSNRIVLFHKT
jgi:hypothetical protein